LAFSYNYKGTEGGKDDIKILGDGEGLVASLHMYIRTKGFEEGEGVVWRKGRVMLDKSLVEGEGKTDKRPWGRKGLG
jgi:hypothetical protein